MNSKTLKVCLVPLEIEWGDKESNIRKTTEIFSRIHPETDLVILPETFSTGFFIAEKEEVRKLSERNTGNTVDFLKSLSARHRVAIAGSYIADSGGSLYNRAFFIEPSGEETFADKKHLFTMAGEDKVFSYGHGRLGVRYLGWNIAMVVCFDIRFPVWCRNRDNEYDLLIAVANWPEVRIDAWNKLLPARAIENEAYVCGVNCKGTDNNGFVFDGSSAAIDFKGKDVSVRMDSDGLIYATLDYDKLQSFRKKFPAWQSADSFSLGR